MTVLSSLTREHRLFERLVEQMRRAIELPPEAAEQRVPEALRTLLPALKRHDAIEELVFGRRTKGSTADERRARQMVEAQHAALKSLEADIAALLERPNIPLMRLRGLAELLAERLDWHFKTEERLLWPLQANAFGRPLNGSLKKRLEKSVRDLERTAARLSRGTEMASQSH